MPSPIHTGLTVGWMTDLKRPAAPKMTGFDRTQLEQNSVWMERYIAQGKFPKSSILIARTGHEVYHHAARLQDLEAELPFERDTVVRALFNDQTCHLGGENDGFGA